MFSKSVLVFAILGSSILWAQHHHVQTLDTIYLSDQHLKVFNIGQKQTQISNSEIQKSSFALTDLLQQHSMIYFKQNGYGMVSSPAFRGTTASQTAVIWNGININSQLTGQTDFNTLLSANFSSIAIKYGGGSVFYGTGAIGGSIHLNQDLPKELKEEHHFQSVYGSFNTFETKYSYQNQFDKIQFKLAFARKQSDNDYKIPSQNRRNENGKFNINSLDAIVNFELSNNNQLKYFGNYTFGERHFSLITHSDPKTKFDNNDTRNMLEWQSRWKNYQSKLKLALLTEDFTYYDNLNRNTSTSSKLTTQWFQYEFWIELKQIKINSVLHYQNSQSESDQLFDADRDIAGVSVLFQHQINKKFDYEVSLRQDVNDDFKNPFLLSLGTSYQPNTHLTIRWHASKDYRLPTFNDLFWINGGNPNLDAETSYQTELGADFSFERLSFSSTGFYNDINDMIRWLPDAENIWRPLNTDQVQTYGVETSVGYQMPLTSLSSLKFKGQYAYTISENQDTGKQLIYVPYHQANAELSYVNRLWSSQLYWRYTGSVFTQSDNNPNKKVSAYNLFDFQVSRQIPEFLHSELSLRLQNIFDLAYETVNNRPMPGRSIHISLNTQF
ncbi:TonB-dependent siderophore receptor [Flavobacterium sp. CS20]|uniref:TonB-dependent receptor plug domain-containing protein n=1 Tax=Flavobacterium sp. CS20 TaxID=2775246 RepID=UPI001B39F25A|nr:TonB-dependent receptor [Flavobacterium sp. CS20]QTY27833.1 TonB-dependent receptor [Flavobacterium sp. CS20]